MVQKSRGVQSLRMRAPLLPGKIVRSSSLAETDKSLRWHGFLDFYEGLALRKLCGKRVKILELGLMFGASLSTLTRYYGDVDYVTVDHLRKPLAEKVITDTRAAFPSASIEAWYMDVDKDIDSFAKRAAASGPFDIVLDDGSHRFNQQFNMIKHLLPLVKPGGYFILEDLHTSIKGDPYDYTGGSSPRQTPLAAIVAIGNMNGGSFESSSAFTDADLAQAKALTAQVWVQYHVHHNKPKDAHFADFRPFTSVTAIIQKRLAD
jgi:hypothetical protein